MDARERFARRRVVVPKQLGRRARSGKRARRRFVCDSRIQRVQIRMEDVAWDSVHTGPRLHTMDVRRGAAETSWRFIILGVHTFIRNDMSMQDFFSPLLVQQNITERK